MEKRKKNHLIFFFFFYSNNLVLFSGHVFEECFDIVYFKFAMIKMLLKFTMSNVP